MSNLGRGLKELFDENKLDQILEGEVVVEIELSKIDVNPYQPRRKFDEIKLHELMLSIKEHGVFQPIILKKKDERYILISGERRFRASKLLNLETIPAIIRDYSENEMAEIALIENVQREDLTAIEEALGYKNIIDKLNYTQKEVAIKVGKSRSYITNMLGLLNLDDNIKDMILNNKISMGHARVLSKLEDKSKINELADRIIKEELTVRDIENITRNEKKNNNIKRKKQQSEYSSVEKLLKEKYNVQFKINDDKILIKSENNDLIKEIILKLL